MANQYLKEYKIMINLLSIEPLVERVKKMSHKIVLFGSWRDGTDTEDSDIDLFVVSSEKAKLVIGSAKKFLATAENLLLTKNGKAQKTI